MLFRDATTSEELFWASNQYNTGQAPPTPSYMGSVKPYSGTDAFNGTALSFYLQLKML